MELRQIQYFIAIAELEHFGQASQRLRIAQPALSRQIRLLEAELGIDLFERLPRGVRLTEAGRVFLQHVRDFRQRLDQAVMDARTTAAGLTGTLRLGVTEVVAWHGTVPESVRRFRAQNPKVRLLLTAMSRSEQIEAIRSKTLDAGLLYNAPADADLEVLPLERHPVMLACHAESRFAQMPSVRLRDLADEDVIGFRRQESPRFHDELQAAYAQAGLVPRFTAEMRNEADMLALVSAGAGMALVNSCQRFRSPHSVRFRPVDDLNVTLPLSLVVLRDTQNPTVRQFIRTLEARALDAS